MKVLDKMYMQIHVDHASATTSYNITFILSPDLISLIIIYNIMCFKNEATCILYGICLCFDMTVYHVVLFQ